jgi:hypothetical protein
MTKPILPPLHGPFPPQQVSPPALPHVPAVPDDGWYLCVSQDIYGPYAIVQLIESAKDGRISVADAVLHATATENAWVSVTRLPQVSMHIRPVPPAIDKNPIAPIPRATPRQVVHRPSRRSSGIHWFRDVVGPLISVSLMLTAYLHFTEQPKEVEQKSVLIAPRQPYSARVTHPSSQTSRMPVPEPIERRSTIKPNAEPTPFRSFTPPVSADDEFAPPRRPDPRSSGNLAGLLEDANPKPKQEPLLVVDLDLNAGFQVVDLPEIPPNRRLAISRFTSPSQNKETRPSDSVVTDTRPVAVKPYGDLSVYLEVKGISTNGGELSKVRIDCKTDLDWLGGDTLSLDRLKRKRIAMIKQRVPTLRFDAFCRTLSNTFTDAKLEFVAIE